jgi:hypothetical protein
MRAKVRHRSPLSHAFADYDGALLMTAMDRSGSDGAAVDEQRTHVRDASRRLG